jgi:hypothetical protein
MAHAGACAAELAARPSGLGFGESSGGNNEALRAGKGHVVEEAPAVLRQPVAGLVDTVDVTSRRCAAWATRARTNEMEKRSDSG